MLLWLLSWKSLYVIGDLRFCFLFPYHLILRNIIWLQRWPNMFIHRYTNEKTWSQPFARSTHLGLRTALLVETSNAESPTRMCMYITHLPRFLRQKSPSTDMKMYTIHPCETFPLLCFWQAVEFAKFRCVKTKALVTPFQYVYQPPPRPTGAFSKRLTWQT